MDQSLKNTVSVALIDSTILAIGQLLQPVDPEEIYLFAGKTKMKDVLNKGEFKSHFRELERNGFFWRTADNKYIVTPRGESLARTSMGRKDRDKVRLLLLNKKRYMK